MSHEKCTATFMDNGGVIRDVTWYNDQPLGDAKKVGPLRGKGVVVKGRHVTYNETPLSLQLADASEVHVIDYGEQVESTFILNGARVSFQWHEREPFGCVKDCPELKGKTILVNGKRIGDDETPVSLGIADVTKIPLVLDASSSPEPPPAEAAVPSDVRTEGRAGSSGRVHSSPAAPAAASTTSAPAPAPSPRSMCRLL
jgi:hypothetical protein